VCRNRKRKIEKGWLDRHQLAQAWAATELKTQGGVPALWANVEETNSSLPNSPATRFASVLEFSSC